LDLNLLSLSRVPLFEKLSNDELLRLERCAEERQIRGRQVVFLFEQKYEAVFLLVSGRIKLLRCSPGGREVTLSLVNPLELFGEAGLYSSATTYPYSAEALEDSMVYSFRRSEFESTLQSSPDALLQLFKLQALSRQSADARLTDFIFYDVTARLARLLVTLSRTYGRSTKLGMLLKLKATHQELANLIGSTRETTTLILSEFRRRGLIEFAGRKIIVLEPEQLSEIEGASYLRREAKQVD
jgi:CRP/FNR family cyclic AMP-dependent transcriptional regulator